MVLATTGWTQQQHAATPLFAADPVPLAPIADRLVGRARRILTPPPNATAAPASQ
jgi:hypothetical protein